MAKKIKMVLYAEPGVGKSTFASKAPNPFFICTDGNFEWLNLPDENHEQVLSWNQATKIFSDIAKGEYDQFDTIVIDLIEDLFRWCEVEWCKRHKLEHVGDLDFGKGYDMVNKEFLNEIEKLFAVDKHIILLTHAYSKEEKGRGGITKTKYYPSNYIRDKVWVKIEGKTRYFLRAFTKTESNEEGRAITSRLLSLTKKEEEVISVARGLDESVVPSDIELDWNAFTSVIGITDEPSKKVNVNKSIKSEISKVKENNEESLNVDNQVSEKNTTEEVDEPEIKKSIRGRKPATKVNSESEIKTETTTTVETETKTESKTESENSDEIVIKPSKPINSSQEDKLASIKAKLAAIKKANNQ